MKKRIFLLFVVIIFTFSYVGYIKYTDVKIAQYIKAHNSVRLQNFFKGEIQGEAELVRVIKRSPHELIMIIKWDKHKAYVSIKNWLTKAHDNEELYVFENSKSIKFYE